MLRVKQLIDELRKYQWNNQLVKQLDLAAIIDLQ